MRFTKMHGLGNDYVYVDGAAESVGDPAGVARRVSDRPFEGLMTYGRDRGRRADPDPAGLQSRICSASSGLRDADDPVLHSAPPSCILRVELLDNLL